MPRVEFGTVYEYIGHAVVMIRADVRIALIREMNPPAGREVIVRVVPVPAHLRVAHEGVFPARLQERPRAPRVSGHFRGIGGRALRVELRI